MNTIRKNFTLLRFIRILFLVYILFLMYMLMSCERDDIPIKTTDDILIGALIESDPDFSEFLKLAELTENTGFINAYGSYTCFLPTNEAFNTFLQKNGKSALEEFSDDELRELFKYHMVNDTITSELFTDGKLKTASMNGKYLITGVKVNEEGKASYIINKESEVLTLDIQLGNGVVHKINTVLDPPKLTVMEMISNNPDYSIFAKALEETKINEKLSRDTSLYTVLVQSDQVYKNMGINSYDDLKAKFSNLGDPTNLQDSLNLYMLYHCIPGVNYLADIVLSKSHLTAAPLEVVTVNVNGDQILVNEQEIAGIIYKGSEIDRDASDNSAKNGVIHELKGNIYIKVLLPVPLYWDPTDQPEMVKLTGIYKTPGFSSVYFGQGEIADIQWGGTNTSVGYKSISPTVDNDALELYLRTAVIPWAELKTPLLIKGSYKLWIAYRTDGYGNAIQVKFDDKVLPELLQIGEYGKRPTEISEDDYEAIGYKYYLEDANNKKVACKYLGTVEVGSTGQYTIRFDAITNKRGHLWLDMVQFIPADMDQRWPKFDYDGNMVYEPKEDVPVD